MGFTISHLELDIPEKYGDKITELVLSGEFSAYIADLILRDLTGNLSSPSGANQLPAIKEFYQSPEYLSSVKQVMREVFSEIIMEKMPSAGNIGVSIVPNSAIDNSQKNADAIDVTPRDAEEFKVDIKPNKGSSSLLNKFGKMRKG